MSHFFRRMRYDPKLYVQCPIAFNGSGLVTLSADSVALSPDRTDAYDDLELHCQHTS